MNGEDVGIEDTGGMAQIRPYLQEKSTQGDPNKLVTKVMGRKDTKVHTEQIVKEMISEGRIKRRHERE